MRRLSQIATLALVLLVALPATAALAANPVGVDDPPAAFDDGVAAVAAENDGQQAAEAVGIAEATVEDTPQVAAAPSRSATVPTAAQAQVAGTGQLPFTGVGPGMIPIMSLAASLLLIGGALLYIVAGGRRRDVVEVR